MIEKILERLEAEKAKGHYDFNSVIGEKNVWQKAIDIVQEVAKDGGWIPCSERLPEFDQEVLITADDYAVYQCVMRNGGFHVWEAGWIDKKRVLAWMELPAPYQKGE